MDQEFEKLIKDRYKMLPSDVQKALTSLPLQEIMGKIGSENGLHIDQTGKLYDETMLVLLGIEGVDSFEDNLRKNLNLDANISSRVVTAINSGVFLAIRESLKAMQEAEKKIAEVASTESTSREDILAEIENPTPTNNPKSASAVAQNFIADKLTNTVNLPAQRANVALTTPNTATPKPAAPAPKPQTYSADPYRESIN